jgi:hypothetical protein
MPSLAAAYSRPLALIVDEHADTRETYAIHLREQGIGVVEAADGGRPGAGARLSSEYHHDGAWIERFQRRHVFAREVAAAGSLRTELAKVHAEERTQAARPGQHLHSLAASAIVPPK